MKWNIMTNVYYTVHLLNVYAIVLFQTLFVSLRLGNNFLDFVLQPDFIMYRQLATLGFSIFRLHSKLITPSRILSIFVRVVHQ